MDWGSHRSYKALHRHSMNFARQTVSSGQSRRVELCRVFTSQHYPTLLAANLLHPVFQRCSKVRFSLVKARYLRNVIGLDRDLERRYIFATDRRSSYPFGNYSSFSTNHDLYLVDSGGRCLSEFHFSAGALMTFLPASTMVWRYMFFGLFPGRAE